MKRLHGFGQDFRFVEFRQTDVDVEHIGARIRLGDRLFKHISGVAG